VRKGASVGRSSAATARKAAVAAGACVLLLAAAGCGGDEGIEEGATVTVYAGAQVCAQAKDELNRTGSRAGSVRVRVVCTEPVETEGRLDLAATGANARQAVEDTSSVAYLEAPGPATRFIRPILEEANIALLTTSSGASGTATILSAIRAAGSSSGLRESVSDELGGG
jgi:hypothetical protein